MEHATRDGDRFGNGDGDPGRHRAQQHLDTIDVHQTTCRIGTDLFAGAAVTVHCDNLTAVNTPGFVHEIEGEVDGFLHAGAESR